MLGHEVLYIGVESDCMVPLESRFGVLKRQERVLLRHLHGYQLTLGQEVEFTEGLLEVVDTTKELGCDAHIFKREVSIKGMLSLICGQFYVGFHANLFDSSALALLRDLYLQLTVTHGVGQLHGVVSIYHAFHDVLEFSERQAELNECFQLGLSVARLHKFLVLLVAQFNLVGLVVEEVLADHAPGHDIPSDGG